MKKTRCSLLFILLSFITSQAFAQNFAIDGNGILTCDAAVVGETGDVSGTTYTAVDNALLNTMKGDVPLNVCTTHVTDMTNMFRDSTSFNQDIGNWDVSNVTDMNSMFWSATFFDQVVGNWDVSNVTDMNSMFRNAPNFDQDIGNWDVSNVTDMSFMFYGASFFNQAIGNWDVSNVTDMSFMFWSISEFNQAIGNWDVSKVTNMNGMFGLTSSFDQAIGNWEVSNVTNMNAMFYIASVFNQDLTTWCVSGIGSLPSNFSTSSALDVTNHPLWGTCPANTLTLTGTEGWRMLASPVADSSFTNLLSPIWTQGITGATTESGTANVYTWDTSTATDTSTNWEAIPDMSGTMAPGSAALVYVYSDDNYTEVGDAGFPKTLPVKGTAVQGDQDLSANLNTNINGLTLLGNPFRVDIDWDEVTKVDLSDPVYVYDHNSAGWKTYNGTSGSLTDGIIGAFNGFFVQTDGASPSLTVPESAKKDSAKSFLGKEIAKADPYFFSLELASDSGLTNKAWFQFTEDGEFGIDASDAYQLSPLSSRYVSLASVLNDTTKLDINSLPFITESFEIPLELNTTEPGTHTFSLKDVNFPEDWEIELYDNETNTSSSLEEAYVFEDVASKVKAQSSTSQLAIPPSISSMVSGSKSKESSARFSLHIAPSTSVSNEPLADLPNAVELQQNYPNPFNPSTSIAYGVPQSGKVTLEVFDVLGRKVATLLNGETKTAGRYTLNFNASKLASGMYIYRLRAGNAVITKKLTLIK